MALPSGVANGGGGTRDLAPTEMTLKFDQ